MPSAAPVRPPRRAVVVAFGVATLVCFAVATIARIAFDHVLAGFATPARYSARPPGPDPAAALDTMGLLVVVAIGIGVLLYGTTLVVAVLQQRGTRLPVGLGLVTVGLVLAAVVAGIAADRSADFAVATMFGTLRVACTGLAAASLPAVALGAVRTHTRRARGTRP